MDQETTMDQETNIPTSRELLKERADLLGIEYKPNITDAKLLSLIENAVNPANSVEASVKAKTDDELLSEVTANQTLKMTKLRRVIIACMDPAMKDWDTTPILSISNSIITLPKMVIPLNVEWHLPQAYYDLLKEAKCYTSVRSKDHKGRPITVRKEISKYSIQDLPDLTEEELNDLKQAQIMRDGI